MSKFWAVILLCALARDSRARNETDTEMDMFRLPSHVRPKSYDLRIEPNFRGENSTFTGVVKIEFETKNADNTVLLNVKDLNVTAVTMMSYRGQIKKNVTVNRYEVSEKNEQLTIFLEKTLLTNYNYVITILYTGKIRDDLTGFYLSSYDESNSTM